MFPILAEPFGFPIRAFGVMVALAFLAGYWFSMREARRTGQIDERVIGDLLMWVLIGGLVGARLLYVIVRWDPDFKNRPIQEVLYIWQGGIVSYGGFIGAFLAGWIFTRRHRIPFLKLGDICMPGVLLGQAIGRIGCLLVGDDYGKVADGLPWAIRFPSPKGPGDLFGITVPYRGHPPLLREELWDKYLHPTQLYMMAQAFCIFLILAWVARRKRFEGQVLFLALILYPIGRSICEVFRADDAERGTYFGGALSTSQLISIPVILIGIAGYVIARRRARERAASADRA